MREIWEAVLHYYWNTQTGWKSHLKEDHPLSLVDFDLHLTDSWSLTIRWTIERDIPRDLAIVP